MDNLIIRECTYEDLDKVIFLQQQWEIEDITYGFFPADKRYLEEKVGKCFYIAELNSEIIGFVYGTVHKIEKIGNKENLYII